MSNDRKPKPFKISFKKAFDEIKEKIFKITIFKIKENKASNETEFLIRGENKMTEGIAKKGKTKKDPKLHPEIKQFMEEQNKFNSDVKEFIQEQKKFNSDVKEFMQNQNKKWEEQNKKWKEQDKTNKEIRKFIKDQTQINKDVKNFIANQQETNQVLLTSVKEILLRLERVEKCPTIKKELDEL